MKIFSCNASKYLATKIAYAYDVPLGEAQITKFSDGEIRVEILESVRGKYIFIIQSTFSPGDNWLELFLMIDAAKRASATYITAVIPYFGYARQDRKDKPRVPITAKLMANMLMASGVDRIMTMDLHAPQIQGFFDIPVDHLDADLLFIRHMEETEMDMSNVVFAAPDVGSVKRARHYAQHFNCRMVICDKHREKANEIASMTVIGDVEGGNVILVDDLADTAGTLCKAAQAIMDKGANDVKALCTHPVLSGGAYEKIQSSVISEFWVTDSIPLDKKRPKDKIKVLSAAQLFSKVIRRTLEHKSISTLFKQEMNV